MANLVISPLYRLDGCPKAYPYFQQMEPLCVRSFRKNLVGMDDFVLMENQGGCVSYVPMFEDIFHRTRKLWEEGHNILFTDIDALCIRPLKIFGEYDQFRCFALTDGNKYPDQFPAYFLSGTRYFPREMDAGLWDVGGELWEKKQENLKDSGWDYEQYVWNHMFYSQPGVRENHQEYVRNEYNCYWGLDQAKDATIISFNAAAGWRGMGSIDDVMATMIQWSQRYGI